MDKTFLINFSLKITESKRIVGGGFAPVDDHFICFLGELEFEVVVPPCH